MKEKVKYLIFCILHSASRKRYLCPSCGCEKNEIIDRKYVVTSLRRCASCRLMFRAPTTSRSQNKKFYNKNYEQGYTTRLPDDTELDSYLTKKFKGTERDYSKYIEIADATVGHAGNKLLEYGCSWGYGPWQLKQHGYIVNAIEISEQRSKYARDKLDVKFIDPNKEKDGTYDIIFSAHVLEHVPKVSEVMKLAERLLKPGGIFIAFTPNGSVQYRNKNRKHWRKLWGLVHPNFLDEEYYKNELKGKQYYISSNPYDIESIRNWTRKAGEKENKIIQKLDGDELMIIFKK